MKCARGIFGITLALALIGSTSWGQTGDSSTMEKVTVLPNSMVDSRPFQTFYLVTATQQNDALDVVTAVRNIMPADVKIYWVSGQNAIVMRANPDELMLAQKVINDLDRPKKLYRLTYTIIEMDGGKRVGIQHFAMVLVSGQRTTLKQGTKIPVATGSVTEGSSQTTQMTYLDVGMNFDATLEQYANGARLRSKVEQSGVAEEKSGVGAQDPIVRQTVIEGTSFLTPDKPLVLGSLDIPGSTRHLDVEVVMEQIAP